MNKMSKILWGVVIIGLGLVFGLNALEITQIDIFFDGWWTLFIIVPCAIGLFREQEKLGNIIGIAVGVVLLLWCWELIDISLIWKLFVPAIVVIVGVKIVIGAVRGDQGNKIYDQMVADGKTLKSGFAAFSGTDMDFSGQNFEGAELTAVFGGIKCDLSNAVLEQDSVIKVCAVFGGIDILVPAGVQVRVNTTSVFGGTSNKAKPAQDAQRTIYVSGICLFGGVDIK